MLETIDFSDDDTLYIIGDALDRGPEPIPLLLDIMDRINVVFMLGNHECFLYDYFASKTSEWGLLDLPLWLDPRNGGGITLEQFTALSDDMQEDIITFIKNAPLIIPKLTVGERDFYLCHSTFLDKKFSDTVYMSDVTQSDVDHVVWDREYPFFLGNEKDKWIGKETIILSGHTPTDRFFGYEEYRIFYDKDQRYIDLDCGCARIPSGDTEAKLGCLRLDDMKEFYV